MRKKYLNRTVLLFLLTAIVFACMDENGLLSNRDKMSPEVIEAKVWFESHADGLQLQALGSNEITLLTPDWKKSFSNSDENCKVVEINLISEDNAHFVNPECVEKFEETKDRNYLASNIRLIVRTNKKTKETDGFIMVAYPDLSYAEKNDAHSLKNISYLERDEEFSGSIYYYNMEGDFVNGWRYKEGTAYVVYPKDSNNSQLRSQTCYDVYETTYHYTDWYTNERYQETVYHGSTTEYIATHCYETGDGDYPPYGGHYGGGGGGNSPTQPQKRDDCLPSMATNSATINDVLKKTNGGLAQVKSNIDLLKEYAKSKSGEYGLTVQYMNNQYSVLLYKNKYIQEGTTEISVSYSISTYLVAHSHPKIEGKSMAPSAGDVSALANMYRKSSKNIQASVIFAANGTEYLIFVDRRDFLDNFCKDTTNNNFFELNSAGFYPGSKWDTMYKSVSSNLSSQGYSSNDAQSYALSFVLDLYKTGLKIYKKESGKTDFKEQKTEEGFDKDLNTKYIPQICP